MTIAARWRDLGTALFVLLGSIAFLLWARTYPHQSRVVPELVAWVTIALAVVDVVIQVDTGPSRRLRQLVSAKRVVEWKMDTGEGAGLVSSLLAAAWVLGYVLLLYLVGFKIATPIYIFLYMLVRGGHSVRNSVLITAATTLAIWLTFEVLFKYPLYPGVLLGGYP